MRSSLYWILQTLFSVPHCNSKSAFQPNSPISWQYNNGLRLFTFVCQPCVSIMLSVFSCTHVFLPAALIGRVSYKPSFLHTKPLHHVANFLWVSWKPSFLLCLQLPSNYLAISPLYGWPLHGSWTWPALWNLILVTLSCFGSFPRLNWSNLSLKVPCMIFKTSLCLHVYLSKERLHSLPISRTDLADCVAPNINNAYPLCLSLPILPTVVTDTSYICRVHRIRGY